MMSRQSKSTWIILGGVLVLALAGFSWFYFNTSPVHRPAPLILFDAAHAQTAGNADWVIGSEPDWVGGYSTFAEILRKAGYRTSSLPTEITDRALEGVSVLVLPEPNNRYTPAEIRAILSFVKNGGGLFLIADHTSSDRDHDGIDSVGVFNEFAPDAFHIRFNTDFINSHPIAIPADAKIIHTPGRPVRRFGFWAGSSIYPGRRAKALLAMTDDLGRRALLAVSRYGKGKIFGIGDSSPFEDNTGNPRPGGGPKKLHDDIHDPNYDIANFTLNVFAWLASPAPDDAGVPDKFEGTEGFIELTEPTGLPWADEGSAPRPDRKESPRKGGRAGQGGKEVSVGDELTVTIEDIGKQGDGLARINGKVTFVPGTKVGDKVRIRITQVRDRINKAEVIR